MKLSRARVIQFLTVLVAQALALLFFAYFSPYVQISSFMSAVAFALILAVLQAAVWWLFINFLAHLPALLFPLLTFILMGVATLFVANYIPGVTINGFWPALWVTVWITVINAILGAILVLDEDANFDRNVTRKMVQKHGVQEKTDVPGFLFLEIDGLSIDIFKRAIADGYMPTVKKWLDNGSHRLLQWETDFTSQTGAMQTGILLGNNDNVPAYRWWSREQGRMIMSGNPKDAFALESSLSTGKGLLSDGGASRGNMFSGDATESLFTMSTITARRYGRGPRFYTYLFNPFIIARLIARFFIEVVKEWWEASAQRRAHKRGDPNAKYVVNARNPAYAFLRGMMGTLLQDLATYTVIGDIFRGVPAIYALYAGYDDLAHFAGMQSQEAFEMLHETDRYFARIERAMAYAPRPYHILVLSDHGQSQGPTFKGAHGISLEDLVKGLLKGNQTVFGALDTNEAWDNWNAVLTESTQDNTRTAALIRRAMASKTKDGVVTVGPDRDPTQEQAEKKASEQAKIVVFGSGSTGLIYFTDSKERMTIEQISDLHPDLIVGLQQHPGIGLVIVKSEKNGTMVIGKGGVNYIDIGTVEGVDPLKPFGPNAALHVKRESDFEDCPDILVNTLFDPQTEELAGFENQVSHHGGLGGPQNRPFVLYPQVLPYDGKPIVWAKGLYRLLRGWREQVQHMDNSSLTASQTGAQAAAAPTQSN
ncbi:MAG: hypothetical protein HDKAJFGB_03319 [Anaerolineae bacterium]|nr:hypothetical protein [Anaerolineae bacterium]RIK33418.1 MAG: hypothetical protein DCC52_03330 [Chloroflexota bacterium]